MPQKQCDKCSEMVDEAKAFCPGCGNAFVEEEKRQNTSEFDRLDSTVQLGQTMYNQMLSDIGLNIPKAPAAAEKPADKSAQKSAQKSVEKKIEVLIPAAAAAMRQETLPVPPKASNRLNWFIIGGAVLVFGFLTVIVAAILIIIYLYRPR